MKLYYTVLQNYLKVTSLMSLFHYYGALRLIKLIEAKVEYAIFHWS